MTINSYFTLNSGYPVCLKESTRLLTVGRSWVTVGALGGVVLTPDPPQHAPGQAPQQVYGLAFESGMFFAVHESGRPVNKVQ